MNNMIYKFKKYIFAVKKFKQSSELSFNKYSAYLKIGKYKYSFKYTYYFHENFDRSLYPPNLFSSRRKKQGNNTIESLILKLTFYFIALKVVRRVNKSKMCDGETYQADLIFNKSGLGFKLFDSKNKKIISIIPDLDDGKTIDEIHILNNNFNTPIKNIKHDGELIIENWIENDFLEGYSQNEFIAVYSSFLDDLISYTTDYDFSSSVILYSKQIFEDLSWLLKELPNDTYQKLITIDSNFPLIYFFYDINLSNFFINNKDYKFIDYEGFRNMSPFSISMIVLLMLSKGTKFKAIYNFKIGTFDDKFCRLLTNMNTSFKPSLKYEYYILYNLQKIWLKYGNLMLSQKKQKFITKSFKKTLQKYHSIKVP